MRVMLKAYSFPTNPRVTGTVPVLLKIILLVKMLCIHTYTFFFFLTEDQKIEASI